MLRRIPTNFHCPAIYKDYNIAEHWKLAQEILDMLQMSENSSRKKGFSRFAPLNTTQQFPLSCTPAMDKDCNIAETLKIGSGNIGYVLNE